MRNHVNRYPDLREALLPLDFVVVDDELLLQDLDSVQIAGLLLLRQHDLTEVTLTQDGEEVEVVEANLALARRGLLRGRLLHLLR